MDSRQTINCLYLQYVNSFTAWMRYRQKTLYEKLPQRRRIMKGLKKASGPSAAKQQQVDDKEHLGSMILPQQMKFEWDIYGSPYVQFVELHHIVCEQHSQYLNHLHRQAGTLGSLHHPLSVTYLLACFRKDSYRNCNETQHTCSGSSVDVSNILVLL